MIRLTGHLRHRIVTIIVSFEAHKVSLSMYVKMLTLGVD